MPKVNRGGRRFTVKLVNNNNSNTQGAGNAPFIQPQQTPQQAQAQQQNVQQAQQALNQQPSATYQQMLNMTDDQKAKLVNDILKMTSSQRRNAVPNWLDDSVSQVLAYQLDMDDAPNVVDANTFNSMSGKTLYRTVGDAYDPQTGIYYKPSDITDQFMYGDITRYNSNGGTALGNGIYFADSYTGSMNYGSISSGRSRYRGIGKEMMRMKFSDPSKVVTRRTLDRIIQNSTGAIRNMYNRLGSNDLYSVCALLNGYHVIDHQSFNGYYTVVNRSSLVMDQNTKSNPDNYRSW